MNISNIWIGASNWNYYHDLIDEIQLYNYALDPQMVAREYRRPDMILGWNFNEPQDIDARNFISTYYGNDFHTTNSLNLLRFLPGFLEL